MSKNIEIKIDNDFTPLPDDSPAKVTIAGNFTEVTTMKHKPNMEGLKDKVRLSKDQYICMDTGEIREYSKMLDRADNPHLQETLKKIRQYINANFHRGGQFLTLCYDGCMTDFFKAKDDLNSFLKVLRKANRAAREWHVAFSYADEREGSYSGKATGIVDKGLC